MKYEASGRLAAFPASDDSVLFLHMKGRIHLLWAARPLNVEVSIACLLRLRVSILGVQI